MQKSQLAMRKDSMTPRSRGQAVAPRVAKGDVEGALKDYDEAVRLKSDYALAFYNRALARKANGDVESALKDYDECIRLNPDYALGLYHCGKAREAKGDGGALQDYKEAIRLEPKFTFLEHTFDELTKRLRPTD